MRRLAALWSVMVGLLAFASPASAAAPASTGVPAISGTLAEGQQLAATQGIWDNTANAPSTFAYQWQRCNVSCINIPYAVESGYVPMRGDVGATLKVAVTATNAGGSTTATSVATNPISSNGQATYYVDGSSVGGTCSDSNTTTQAQSASTPWCSTTHAASALATTASSVEVLVRGADNAGTQRTYTGTGTINSNGRTGNQLLNLTNDKPVGTVTFEAYGTVGQADNVLIAGVLTNNTSNYTFEGFDIADPVDPNGCPYHTIVDAGGNFPYCLPQDDIQLDKGTTAVSFYNDSIATQINFATTQGQGGSPTGTTLYGTEIHNTGWDCKPLTGMTTSATVGGSGAVTSIPVNSNAVSATIGANNAWRVGIYTGPASNPTTWDSFVPTAGSTSTLIKVSSSTPANSYPAGTSVVAESCNNVNDVGIETSGAVNNLTLSHSALDHIHCTGVQGGGANWTFTYTTFAYILPPNTECHDDAVETSALTTNWVFENNLVYEVNLGIFTGCNPGGQVQCGANWTIENNVFIAVQEAINVGNYVMGTNYIESNTVWNRNSPQGPWSIYVRWSDACCYPGAAVNPGPLAQFYVLNNVADNIGDNETHLQGNASQLIQAEDYNVISYLTSDPTTGAGAPAGPYGTHNIFNAQPSFATGVGVNCQVTTAASTVATSYATTGCAGAATGFNAALLSGSRGIGAGIAGPTGSVATDFLGNTRSAPWDMGAFQFSVDSSGGSGGGGNPLPLPPFLLRRPHHGPAITILDIGALVAAFGLVSGGIFLRARRRRD